ncbi:MAG: hypothetical protein V4510_02725 [bacterium]
MAKRRPLNMVFRALNERLYPAFDAGGIEWEGRQVPEGFGPRVRRLRRAGGPEKRAQDPAAIEEAFLYHFRLGTRYGYPECCVLQYAMEAPVISPLLLRGGITLSGYVPCDACLESYLLDYIEDGPDWDRKFGPTAPVD